jgi:hypothetical protein
MAIPDAVKAKVRGGCSDKIMGLYMAELHQLMALTGERNFKALKVAAFSYCIV